MRVARTQSLLPVEQETLVQNAQVLQQVSEQLFSVATLDFVGVLAELAKPHLVGGETQPH